MRSFIGTAITGIVLISSLSGCVHETTYLIDGMPSREVQYQPSEAALTRMNLGLAYLQAGNSEQAKFNLDRALSQDPRNPDIHLALAWFYQQVADFTKAEQRYREVLALDKDHGDALNNYGVFLCERERFEEADVMFRKAVAAPHYIKVADSYENAALCAKQQGQERRALHYFNQALEYNSSKPKALLGAAELLFMQKDYVEAGKYLQRYRNEFSATPHSLWLTLSNAQALHQGPQVEQAGADLVRLFPNSKQARQWLSHDEK